MKSNGKKIITRLVSLLIISIMVVPTATIVADLAPVPPYWTEKIGEHGAYGKGFGNNHNIATRGMTIYNNELYVGTQNQCGAEFPDPVHDDELVSQYVAEYPTNQIQGLSQKSGATQFTSNGPLNQFMQTAYIEEQQQEIQQIQQSEMAPPESDGDDDHGYGYDPHYMFSPDGGEHTYYLPTEIFGLDGVTDLFLQKVLETFGTIGIRAMFQFGTGLSDGCEIWKYNNATGLWTQVVGPNSIYDMPSGFGYNHNFAIGAMQEFSVDHKLYVGTWGTPGFGLTIRKGCEIYRFDGSTWEPVVSFAAFLRTGRTENNGGFGNSDNMGVCSMEEYDGYLYVGTMNFDVTDTGGTEIWRTNDGENWERVVDHGFRPIMSDEDRDNGTTNLYSWEMRNYSGNLYVGTANGRGMLSNVSGPGYGCQLWTTSDGVHFREVDLPGGDGFGEHENLGIRRMNIYNGLLYIGTATMSLPNHPPQGCEVWTYDGTSGPDAWHNIAGEEAYNEHSDDPQIIRNSYKDGFGNVGNGYAWSMTVTSSGVWIGTNKIDGCQIVQWNGTDWIPIVRTGDGEMPDGFDDLNNTGLRSLIEYPEGTGIIVAGTFTNFFPTWNPETHWFNPVVGCEIWMRYP